MKKIANKLTDLIGNTPLLRLNNYNPQIIAKLESFNPLSSVKDRIGYAMIIDGLKRGIINKDTTIVEPTSGNTGIGLAFVAASMGLKLTLTMPETMSIERRGLLMALGAKLVLTEGAKGMKGAIEMANQLTSELSNCVMLDQFSNDANPRCHRDYTALEIWNDTDGEVDIFIAGVGTGGTISGVGEGLKALKDVRIVAVEPAASPVLSGGKPGPHKIQGIGPGFVPKTFKREFVDEIVTITNEDAIKTMQDVASSEGLLIGISGGAIIKAASILAEKYPNKCIVALIPDTGERYLSTGYFTTED